MKTIPITRYPAGGPIVLYAATLRAENERLLEALEAIEKKTPALRQGGPAPEDLQQLSDALEACVNIASDALEKLREIKPS